MMITRGHSAADANVNDPPEDPTVAASVPEESTVVVSVPQVSTAMSSVPVLDSTLASIVPEKNPTVLASAPEAAVRDSLLGYLHLVRTLEKRVSRTDDQSLALITSSNVSIQHRKRAVDIENSFMQGLSAIGESYGCN